LAGAGLATKSSQGDCSLDESFMIQESAATALLKSFQRFETLALAARRHRRFAAMTIPRIRPIETRESPAAAARL
jgi:hypothetical protein